MCFSLSGGSLGNKHVFKIYIHFDPAIPTSRNLSYGNNQKDDEYWGYPGVQNNEDHTMVL